MHQQEFKALLKKYQKGLCTDEEKALVEEWFHALGSSKMPSLPESHKEEIKQRSWTRVNDHMIRTTEQDAAPERTTFAIPHAAAWAVAATVLLMIVSAVFLMVGPREGDKQIISLPVTEQIVSNNSESVMDVRLSDGTSVALAPESTLSFTEPFDSAQRLVALEGEAFFAVSKDPLRPFLVNTKEVITKVLGTSFTVSAFPDEDNITVSVMTGKVSVMTKKGNNAGNEPLNETILTPNQKIIYNKNKNIVSRGIVKEPVPIIPPDVVKRMHFEAAPIRKIFDGLEQVYGVDIEFDEKVFSTCILTTSIAEGTIYDRLDMICKAIDAQYFIQENHIVITGRGCNH